MGTELLVVFLAVVLSLPLVARAWFAASTEAELRRAQVAGTPADETAGWVPDDLSGFDVDDVIRRILDEGSTARG